MTTHLALRLSVYYKRPHSLNAQCSQCRRRTSNFHAALSLHLSPFVRSRRRSSVRVDDVRSRLVQSYVTCIKSFHKSYPVSRSLYICHDAYGHVVARAYTLTPFVIDRLSRLLLLSNRLPFCLSYSPPVTTWTVTSTTLTVTTGTYPVCHLSASVITCLLLYQINQSFNDHTTCLLTPRCIQFSSPLSVRIDGVCGCQYSDLL